jgi:hypothetical protein
MVICGRQTRSNYFSNSRDCHPPPLFFLVPFPFSLRLGREHSTIKAASAYRSALLLFNFTLGYLSRYGIRARPFRSSGCPCITVSTYQIFHCQFERHWHEHKLEQGRAVYLLLFNHRGCSGYNPRRTRTVAFCSTDFVWSVVFADVYYIAINHYFLDTGYRSRGRGKAGLG